MHYFTISFDDRKSFENDKKELGHEAYQKHKREASDQKRQESLPEEINCICLIQPPHSRYCICEHEIITGFYGLYTRQY